MKWLDLSFKEKKQIYDRVKAQNPDTTYLDIKHQFDSIPEYEDGKDNSVAAVYSLPEVTVYPQNKFGDIARTQGYETAKNWQTVRNAPKFANIKSPDAPIHLGRSSKPLGGELNPTVYDVVGTDLNLYKTESNRVKGLLQSNLEALKYDGIQTPSQITVFPGSVGSMGDNIYGKANMKNIQDGFTSSNVDDYSIVLDPSTYMPGTANHELGHMADGIAGSIKYEAEPGVDYITNPYLRYLADPDNTYTTKELRDAGFHSAARNKRYLLNPTESKSHMLTLKRALKDSNKISKWSDPVDENMILDYFRSGRANGAVRNQYDLYIDKQRYIDRLNRLVPMEWLLPTIGLGGAEFLREKQNNKSN